MNERNDLHVDVVDCLSGLTNVNWFDLETHFLMIDKSENDKKDQNRCEEPQIAVRSSSSTTGTHLETLVVPRLLCSTSPEDTTSLSNDTRKLNDLTIQVADTLVAILASSLDCWSWSTLWNWVEPIHVIHSLRRKEEEVGLSIRSEQGSRIQKFCLLEVGT